MGRLDGRVALVTGSTQGVGEAVVRRFAAEGASGLVVCGRNGGRGEAVAEDLRRAGVDAMFVPVELADPDSCRALVAASAARFGRIDTLVNAAGLSLRGTILDTDVELFDQLMAVNARAPFVLMQDAIRVMIRESIEGTIVNVASLAADGSVPMLMPYAASKAALVTMSRNVAYAVAWHRIRVNVIRPGWIATPGEDVVQRRFHGAGDGWLDEAAARQPFGRLIEPDELAGAVTYLASPESGLLTGAVLDFDQSVTGAGQPAVPARGVTPCLA